MVHIIDESIILLQSIHFNVPKNTGVFLLQGVRMEGLQCVSQCDIILMCSALNTHEKHLEWPVVS